MRNLQFPNPAQPSDVTTLIAQALLAVRQAAPVLTVVASPTGSTTYDYVVVAKSNGIVIPSAVVVITNGGSTLSATETNTLSWNPSNLNDVTYDVYRTVGGATQGLIAADITTDTLVDIGLVAVTQTPPSFNTSGILAAGTVPKIQVCPTTATGAITLLSGIVFLTGAAAVLATLPLPLAGTPDSGGQDGATLRIQCTTAHAHTVTTPASGINPAHHVITFAAANDFQDLTALNGVWVPAAGNGTIS